MIPPPVWDSHARADLRALEQQTAHRILITLATYLATGEGDVKMLTGPLAGRLRLRVGDWRLIFRRTEDGRVQVLRVMHRREVYRG